MMSTQVAAGIASLWGPMHGGANEACIRMLREIGTKERIPEFLARAKDKSDPFKLMGFGHRAAQRRWRRAPRHRCDGFATVPAPQVYTETSTRGPRR